MEQLNQDKINRKPVHKSVQKGGLGLPNLKTFIAALKLTWIQKFKNDKHNWKKYSNGEISIY